MLPDIHQSIEEILKAASPEQLILWSQSRLLCGENAAIRPISYTGNLTGSEFTGAGVPRRLYIGYLIELSYTSSGGATDAPTTIVTPTGNFILRNQSATYNSGTAQYFYAYNSISVKNYLFTQLVEVFGGIITKLNFIGYRITY